MPRHCNVVSFVLHSYMYMYQYRVLLFCPFTVVHTVHVGPDFVVETYMYMYMYTVVCMMLGELCLLETYYSIHVHVNLLFIPTGKNGCTFHAWLTCTCWLHVNKALLTLTANVHIPYSSKIFVVQKFRENVENHVNVNFRAKKFGDWMSNHEIHENNVPWKFGAIR